MFNVVCSMLYDFDKYKTLSYGGYLQLRGQTWPVDQTENCVIRLAIANHEDGYVI